MSEEKPYHLRGVVGQVDRVTGEVTRPGHRYTVVLQPDEGHEPLDYGHFSNRDDAVLYMREMTRQGARGLRIVEA